jgi:hypothetical protein
MAHKYQTKISKHRDTGATYYWNVWLWEPANGVQKFPHWALRGSRKSKKETEEYATELLRTALLNASEPGGRQ